MQRTTSSQPMPEYIYMSLPTGEADVFVYKLLEQGEDWYEYESNEFRTKKLKESDIKVNPYRYLNYVETNEEEQKPEYIELTREDYNLLSVEQEVIYHIIEADGTITLKKGVNM